MKALQLLTSTFFLLSTAVAAAPFDAALDTSNDLQRPISSILEDEDPLSVPGDNPLSFCAKPDDYILHLDKVDLDPNPPLAGKNLTINASGNLSKQVDKGAKIRVSVKYGLVKILTQEVDLCEQASVINRTCPVEKGVLKLEKLVTLPALIPPGTYTVLGDIVSKEEETITCLTASVTFNAGGGLESFKGFGIGS